MRAGKPIISTRSTDLSEMIEQDQNGYIVPSDDEDQLVMAMESMLQKSQSEREQMGGAFGGAVHPKLFGQPSGPRV